MLWAIVINKIDYVRNAYAIYNFIKNKGYKVGYTIVKNFILNTEKKSHAIISANSEGRLKNYKIYEKLYAVDEFMMSKYCYKGRYKT